MYVNFSSALINLLQVAALAGFVDVSPLHLGVLPRKNPGVIFFDLLSDRLSLVFDLCGYTLFFKHGIRAFVKIRSCC